MIRADTSLHVPIEIASKWGALQSRSPLSCCGWIQFQMLSFAKPLDRVAVAMFYLKKVSNRWTMHQVSFKYEDLQNNWHNYVLFELV